MHLIWATADFVLNRRPYPGFPILLDKELKGVSPANEFLRYYLTRGSIGSKQSWPNTGRALYDYFSFLEAHELEWTDVRRGEAQTLVGAYRDYCLDTIKLAVSTVRQRLLYVCEFYQYALKQRWVETLPFGHEARTIKRPSSFLAHVDRSGGEVKVRDVTPKAPKSRPKFLSKDEVKRLLNVATNPHHRMILRFGLQTGLRREEIATFPLAYVFDPDRTGRTEKNIRIHIDPRDGNGMRTKRNKPRDIYVSRQFMKDLYYYAEHQRGERAQLSPVRHSTLFLNDKGAPYSTNGKHLRRIISEIGAKVGIKVWPHKLRHTYATHTLHAMHREKMSIDPLVFMQQQLGHESINTTLIYLHLIHELADGAVLAYDDELNSWAKEGQ